MASFRIISKDGTSVRHEGCPTYNGTYLKPSYLEFREICSDSPIDWEVGDYVDYLPDATCTRNGLRYKLYDIPMPVKQGERSGDGYKYQNVQFFAAPKQLEICPFCDIVANDNNVHFSTQHSVSTFENISGIISRIQANLDKYYSNWTIRLYSGLQAGNPDLYAIVTTAREFTVSGGSCMDALTQCYEVFGGIGWVHFVEGGKDIIELGRPDVRDSSNSTSVMRYGQGLRRVTESQTNKDTFGTRLYVYGGQRNINFQYYKSNGEILNGESLDIRNLMLPLSQWGQTGGKRDANKCYLEAPQSLLAKYGVRPKFHYFDGSEDEEIFPTIKGATIKNVQDGLDALGISQYRPDSTKYQSTERVDEIKSSTAITDDGMVTDGGNDTETIGFTPTTVIDSAIVSGTQDFDETYTIGTFTTDKMRDVQIDIPDWHNSFISATGIADWAADVDLVVDGESVSSLHRVTTQDRITFDGGTYHRLSNVPAGDHTIEIAVHLAKDGASARANIAFNDATNWTITLKRITLANTFTAIIRQIGFDIKDRQTFASNGYATLAITKGVARTDGTSDCTGRGFAVKNCVYRPATDDWELTCIRAYDESTGMAYPNNKYTIKTGDNFALLDIAMPELYIKMAENRLLEAGQKLLAEMSNPEPFYAPEIDAVQMARSPQKIQEGMYFGFNDAQLTGGTNQYILIDTLTINEGDANIPTYRITLREKKSRRFTESVAYGTSSQPLTSASIESNDKTVVHSMNIKRISYVTSYPATLESGTLYHLIDSNGVVTETKIKI